MSDIIITVDRIEENIAVCVTDDGRSVMLPVSFFSEGITERDVYEMTLTRNTDMKNDRETRIKRLLMKIKKQ